MPQSAGHDFHFMLQPYGYCKPPANSAAAHAAIGENETWRNSER
jgi:hypothetical protein